MRNLATVDTTENIAINVDRIKYIVNGEVRYYTMDELREHIITLHKSIDEDLSTNELDKALNRTLELLERYDGDPYGHLKKNRLALYGLFHRALEQGRLPTIIR